MDSEKEKILAASFEEIFKKYYPYVYRYIFKKVLNVQIAEDLAMETFASCWENFEKFDPAKASFQTWAFVIANNKLKNYYRDKKDFSELDESLAAEGFENEIESAMQLSSVRNSLASALEELNEVQRKIIIYKYFKGKNSNDIALIMGMTPSNVRVQLKRGIDKLKEYFIKKNIRWE